MKVYFLSSLTILFLAGCVQLAECTLNPGTNPGSGVLLECKAPTDSLAGGQW